MFSFFILLYYIVLLKRFKEKLTFGAWPWIPDPGSVRKNNFSKGFLKKKLTFGARPWIPDPGSVRKNNGTQLQPPNATHLTAGGAGTLQWGASPGSLDNQMYARPP